MRGRFAKGYQVDFTLLIFSVASCVSFHDDFEDSVEFVVLKAFDVFSGALKVAANMGIDDEMEVDRSGIALEDFKICFVGR